MPRSCPMPRFLCMEQVGITAEGGSRPPEQNRAPATRVTCSVTIVPPPLPRSSFPGFQLQLAK